MQLNRSRLTSAALAAALLLVAVPRAAEAIEYEVFIDVETEEELFDLLEQQQIDEATFDQLVESLRVGVDLNTASRDEIYGLPNLSYEQVDAILEYRRLAGRIVDPADLVPAGVLTREQLVALAPFLRVTSTTPSTYAVDGFVRMPVLLVPGNDDPPPAALEGRVSSFKYFTLGGAMVLTHDQLDNVAFDPQRGALSADGYAPRLKVPKLYLRYEQGDFAAIVGTYRIGFGQRLTFDNSLRAAPNGFVEDDDLLRDTGLTRACKESTGELGESPCTGRSYEYTAPDFKWRQGMLGAAVSLRGLRVGPGELQLHAFGSSASRPIYQYEIYDAAVCEDPNDDTDPGCAAPQVFKRRANPNEATSRFAVSTLPDMFRENTVGGNISYFTGPRSHVGVTGYVSSIDWLIDGIDLDFQEYARYPRGGAFGAVGVDGHFRLRELDLFAEVTRSFDATPTDQGGGGDLAAILRGTYTFDKTQEIEASTRYYGEGFANPYGRPIAQPDEHLGLRARNEMGARVKYTGSFNRRLSIRAALDLWASADDERTKRMQVYFRGDWLATQQLGFGLWTQFQDKDLGRGNDGDACYEIPNEEDAEGEPVSCSGVKFTNSARLHFSPLRTLRLAAQFTFTMLDDPNARFDTTSNKRKDLSAWLTASWWPTDELRVRGRMRYLDDGVGEDDYLETSVWGYLEVSYRVRKAWSARVRYDLYSYTDDRDSTAERTPNPEQWIWLEATLKF